MIIATHTNEYLALAQRHFFLMSNNNIEFPSLLKKALQELKIWNSAEKQRARKAFALENTKANRGLRNILQIHEIYYGCYESSDSSSTLI